MTQTHIELPRCVVLELINLSDTKRIAVGIHFVHCIIIEVGIVLGFQVVEGRRCYRQSDSEGRLLDGTCDDTCCQIEACTLDATIITVGHNTGIAHILIIVEISQTLSIFTVTFIVHCVYTNSETPVNTAIGGISAEIEVEVADPTTMGTVEVVHLCIIIVHISTHFIVAPHIETVDVQIVELVVGIGSQTVSGTSHIPGIISVDKFVAPIHILLVRQTI